MKKSLLLLAFTFWFSATALHAATVGVADAQLTALNFFKITYPEGIAHNSINAVLRYTRRETDSTADFYVFDINPMNGFVIVAAHNEVIPILAYSNESYFDTTFSQTGLVNWVNKTAAQIHLTAVNQLSPDARIAHLWNSYMLAINPGAEKSNSLGPMLTTTWNQEPYYNEYCPVNPNDGQRSVTGCVATAMAQIMKFWNYPAQGTGSYSYIDNAAHGYQNNIGTLSANFGATTYAWTQMPNHLTANNTAIGTLMSHCGISVAMDYSDEGSGAYVIQSEANSAFGYANSPCAQHSYITYFSYDPTTIRGVFQNNYTAAQWLALLEGDMNLGHVIQYEGFDPYAGGHTWVCDGYDVNNNLHMNWGWGGADNGFFAATNLSAGGYTFDYDDAALIGIQPLHPAVDTTCTATASFVFQNLGGSDIQFTNTSNSNHVFTSSWDFYNAQGQFATSAIANPQITFIGVSPYTAILTIIDTFHGGCSDTMRQNITFNPSTQCLTLQHGSTKATGAAISSSTPATNFDFTNYYEFFDAQWTNGGSPTEARSLIKYDFSQIPAGSVIVSAGLSLYVDTASVQGYADQPTYGSDNASYLHLVTSAWNPATVTWNTQPTASNTSEVLLPQSTSAKQDYLNIDISSFVQSWLDNPAQNYGLLLQLITQNHYNDMLFCSSSNADTAKWPKLQVCFIPPNRCHAIASFVQQNLGAGQVRFTNTSTDNSAFTSHWVFYNASGQFGTSNLTNPTITFTGQQPYSATLVISDSVCADTLSQPVNLNNCITLQYGSTKPTGAAIATSAATTNFDFTSYYEFFDAQWTNGGAPAEGRSMMKYDFSQIPVGSNILSASLSLYTDTASNQGYADQPTYGTNNASYLHLITSNWNPATVTWNTQPAISNNAEVLLPQSTSVNQDYLNIDISGFVQNWVNNPNTNYGMLLKMITQNHYNDMLFCSPGNADSTKWPKLEICYQLPSPCQLGASFTQQNLGNGQVQFTNTSAANSNTAFSWKFYNAAGIFAGNGLQNPVITFHGSPPFSATLIITDTTTACTDTLQQPVNITTCITIPTDLQGDSVQNVGSAQAGINFGLLNDFFASQWTFNGTAGEDVGLIKFNLSAIPVGVTVASASLSLFADTASSEGFSGQPMYGTANACYLQQLTSPWSELGVTWNSQPAFTATGQVLLAQSTSATQNYPDIDISSFIQNWVQNPLQNFGLRLKMISTSHYNSLIFCSSVYPDSSKRPLLQVCYFTPVNCGATDSFTYHNSGNGVVQFNNLSNSNNGVTCNWEFYNGNGLFANSTQMNPVITFTGAAPYYAQLIVADSVSRSCVDTFSEQISVITGIAGLANESVLVIFPNPGNGKNFNVKLPADLSSQSAICRIFDVFGREVNPDKAEQQANYFRLSLSEGEAPGIYTIILMFGEQRLCGKLVVVK